MFDADSVRWRRILLVLEHFDFRGNLTFQRMDRLESQDDSSHGLCTIADDRECLGIEALREAIRCHPLFWPLAGLMVAWSGADSVGWAKPAAGVGPAGRCQTAQIDPTLKFKFALVAFCAVMQVALIPKSPIFHPKSTSTAFTANRGWLHELEPMAHAYFGVCSHGVFLDHHFENYDHIVAVTYIEPDGTETWLPLTRPSGQVGWYSTGRIWAKWAFRQCAVHVGRAGQKRPTRRDCLLGREERRAADRCAFQRVGERVRPRTGWQRNFLYNQAQKPWSPAGTAQWKDGQFSAEIVNIEAI